MKKHPILALLIAALPLAAGAQDPINFDGSFADDSFVVRARVNTPGTYTVVLHFYETRNYSPRPFSDPITVTASGEILRLRPDNGDADGSVRYHTAWVEGQIANNRLDTDFVYRLPLSTHKKEIRAYYPLTTAEAVTRKKIANRVSLGFHADRGDTVFAARKGTVVETATTGADRDNTVQVQHDDGSRAYYSCLARGSAMVGKGDPVWPGIPLALAGESSEGNYLFFFQTGYYRTYTEGAQDYGFEWVYFNPSFAMAKGASRVNSSEPLVAVSYKELVTKEMNNRDRKRYEAGQLPGPTPPAAAAEAVKALAAMGPVKPVARPAPAAAASSGSATAATGTAATRSDRPFQLQNFRDPDGKYTVTAQKNGPGVYSVILTFRDVDNYDIPAVLADTVSVGRHLLRVSPTDPGRTCSAAYSSSYRLGMATVRPDTGFVYRLPFNPRGQLRAYSRRSASSGQWTQGFQIAKNDTVFAVRQGVVVQVQQLPPPKAPANAPAGYRPPPPMCRIAIQHPDGVNSEYYSGVDAASVTVAEGQQVETGQPVGISVSGAVYMTFRYIDIDEGKFRNNTFNPVFATPAGGRRLEVR